MDVTEGGGSARKPRATPIKQAEWNKQRAAVEQLYVHDGKPLHKVMAVMQKRHGFIACKSQYKAQLVRWKLRKNKRKSGDTLGADRGWPSEEEQRHWLNSDYGEYYLTDVNELGLLDSKWRLFLTLLTFEMFKTDSFDLLEFIDSRRTREDEIRLTDINESENILGVINRYTTFDIETLSNITYSLKTAAEIAFSTRAMVRCRDPTHKGCTDGFVGYCDKISRRPHAVLMYLVALLLTKRYYDRWSSQTPPASWGPPGLGYFMLENVLQSLGMDMPMLMEFASSLEAKIKDRFLKHMSEVEFGPDYWRASLIDELDEQGCLSLSLTLKLPNRNGPSPSLHTTPPVLSESTPYQTQIRLELGRAGGAGTDLRPETVLY